MKRNNWRWQGVLVILCIMVFFLIGCGKVNKEGALTELNKIVTEKVLENSELSDLIRDSDIVVDKIYYGAFSEENAEEVLVLCKVLNQPHAGGMDRTMVLVLQTDSLELVTYKEFSADKVIINCIQNDKGQSKVLFLGTTTYQGMAAQDIYLFSIQDKEWIGESIKDLYAISEEHFCLIADDKIIVSSTENITKSSNIICVLRWNPETEQFLNNEN